MKKMSAIFLFIITCSFIFTSCGNFSSADSYLGNVYTRPVVLTKNNAGEENTAEKFTETKTEEGETETAAATLEPSESETHTELEVLPEESETIGETAEIETDIKFAEEQNTGKYLITENGKKFHKDNCRTVKSIKQYITYDDAVKLGYDPCKICNPVND